MEVAKANADVSPSSCNADDLHIYCSVDDSSTFVSSRDMGRGFETEDDNTHNSLRHNNLGDSWMIFQSPTEEVLFRTDSDISSDDGTYLSCQSSRRFLFPSSDDESSTRETRISAEEKGTRKDIYTIQGPEQTETFETDSDLSTQGENQCVDPADVHEDDHLVCLRIDDCSTMSNEDSDFVKVGQDPEEKLELGQKRKRPEGEPQEAGPRREFCSSHETCLHEMAKDCWKSIEAKSEAAQVAPPTALSKEELRKLKEFKSIEAKSEATQFESPTALSPEQLRKLKEFKSIEAKSESAQVASPTALSPEELSKLTKFKRRYEAKAKKLFGASFQATERPHEDKVIKDQVQVEMKAIKKEAINLEEEKKCSSDDEMVVQIPLKSHEVEEEENWYEAMEISREAKRLPDADVKKPDNTSILVGAERKRVDQDVQRPEEQRDQLETSKKFAGKAPESKMSEEERKRITANSTKKTVQTARDMVKKFQFSTHHKNTATFSIIGAMTKGLRIIGTAAIAMIGTVAISAVAYGITTIGSRIPYKIKFHRTPLLLHLALVID